MSSSRVSGLLLHPTSLPGRYGIGDLGPAAHAFVDFLEAAGQRVWQVLPLGPTGYGDSPYQCFSAMAGNPMLVSPERLAAEGWLETDELAPLESLPAATADFDHLMAPRRELLARAFARFAAAGTAAQNTAFERFRAEHAWWLDDFSLFMALKDAHGMRAWTTWPESLRDRHQVALEQARQEHAETCRMHAFVQWQFFAQWQALRQAAAGRGVSLMGDMPIFVAHDSADVWAQPDQFDLLADGAPRSSPVCRPTTSARPGSCWGNPLYRWDAHEGATGTPGGSRRLRMTLALVDRVRLDHFRGFDAYWEVGRRCHDRDQRRVAARPGAAICSTPRAAHRTPADRGGESGRRSPPTSRRCATATTCPAWPILQFAFGTDPQAPDFLPHNYHPRPRRLHRHARQRHDPRLGERRGR